MLVAAALVPDTALLVPGASGRTDPAAGLREVATAAVRRAVEHADRVVVVAPGRAARRTPETTPEGSAASGGSAHARAGTTTVPAVAVVGQVRASLAAAGIPDQMLAQVPPADLVVPEEVAARLGRTHRASVPTAVALRLLAATGRGAAHAVETCGRDGVALRALGSSLVSARTRTALVVVGSASGRHGPDAPLADDPEALAYDDALVDALRSGEPAARERIAALDPVRAEALAVTGWGPWQVLVGATAAEVRADVEGHVLLGAQHVVGTWLTGGAR